MPHSDNELSPTRATPLASAGTAKKVWASLLTNKNYLHGLLTLEFALKKVGSAYRFVVLYTDPLPQECHDALDIRGISKRKVPYLTPGASKDWGDNSHYQDCWTKIVVFSLMEYSRIILLDIDMVVIRNMDELFDIDLTGYPFAACPGCSCNPAQCPNPARSWPSLWSSITSLGWDWSPSSCGWTSQHRLRRKAQVQAPAIEVGRHGTAGGYDPNAGLLVLDPNLAHYKALLHAMSDAAMVKKFNFPEQDLMALVFQDTWKTLPYIYNAIKTMRWEGVHDAIWDDTKVKNIHYICKQKPWQESTEERANFKERDPLHEIWWAMDEERVNVEKKLGIDGYIS